MGWAKGCLPFLCPARMPRGGGGTGIPFLLNYTRRLATPDGLSARAPLSEAAPDSFPDLRLNPSPAGLSRAPRLRASPAHRQPPPPPLLLPPQPPPLSPLEL